MSTPTVTATPAPALPKMIVARRSRLFFTTFGVLILAFLVLVVFAYTLGVSTGFEGQTSFSWDQLGATLGFLFGGVGSALAMIGAIALVVAFLWVVNWLSRTDRRKWLLATIVVALVAAMFLAQPLFQVDWLNIGFGFVPFLMLIAFTALVSGVIVAALSPIPSRKRDTNQ